VGTRAVLDVVVKRKIPSPRQESNSRTLIIHNFKLYAKFQDSLQIQRVAANILNKRLWTTDKGWSSSLEVGQRANNFSL
jgi:hypothetical protein